MTESTETHRARELANTFPKDDGYTYLVSSTVLAEVAELLMSLADQTDNAYE